MLNKNSGLTLVELLVSAAIGLVVMASVLAMITDFMRSQNNAKKVEDLLVTSETVFNRITQDARWADEFQVTASPKGFILTRIIDEHTTENIKYELDFSAYPTQPTYADIYRVEGSNRLKLNRTGVVYVDEGGYFARDYYQASMRPDRFDPNYKPKLIELKLTLLHTNPQGARTVHESSTKISLRNTEINF